MAMTPYHNRPDELERISWWLHLSYLCLFEAGTVSGMWQKVNPNICFLLLILAPFLMLLSRIPKRFFPSIARQLLQLVLVGLGLAWFQQRAVDCPIDIALIECSGVIAVALFLGGRVRELGMQALLAIAFAGYGGLTPGRQVYFPAFFATVVFYLIIMYQTRTSVFASLGNPVRYRMPRFWGNWLYRGLHFILVLAAGIFCLVRFPVRDRMQSKGLAPVSFHSDQELEFPEMWKDWFKSTKKLLVHDKEEEPVEDGEKPDSASSDAKNMLENTRLNTQDAREGSGSSASIGTDLVFRAYTPAKLYWVVQMYDTYDGVEWTRSAMMRNARSALDWFKPAVRHEVTQNISLEKRNGTRLPYAYKAHQIQYRNARGGDEGGRFAIATRYDAVSFILKTHGDSAPPWHYRVQSFVPDIDLKPEARAWNEPERNYGWNYRQLPRRKISARTEELAARITAGLEGPRAKAEAIQEHLRRNYTYDINVRGVPEGRETVDYFLFESRRGYCQHFAQAFVVLARLSGLHARLVTGYSPGRFNVMANLFEVYEYHAHAWAQIFVPPFGWMTYDGVAPGNLNLNDKSNILTSMLDPFGEKWNATPPELTFTPPKKQEPTPPGETKKATGNENQTNQASQVADELYDSIYEKAAMDNNTMDPTVEQLFRAAGGMLKERLTEWKNRLSEAVRERLRTAKSWLMSRLGECMAWFRARAKLLVGATVGGLLLGTLLWRYWRRLKRLAELQVSRFRCWRLWRRLESGQLTGGACITACQRLNSELLIQAGLQGAPSMDLLEKCALFPVGAEALRDDYRLVAEAAFALWYSPSPPTDERARDVLAATKRFRERIPALVKG